MRKSFISSGVASYSSLHTMAAEDSQPVVSFSRVLPAGTILSYPQCEEGLYKVTGMRVSRTWCLMMVPCYSLSIPPFLNAMPGEL